MVVRVVRSRLRVREIRDRTLVSATPSAAAYQGSALSRTSTTSSRRRNEVRKAAGHDVLGLVPRRGQAAALVPQRLHVPLEQLAECGAVSGAAAAPQLPVVG